MASDLENEEPNYDIVEGPPTASSGESWVLSMARTIGSMTRSVVERTERLTGSGRRARARVDRMKQARALLAELAAQLAVRVDDDFATAVESEELWRLINKLARLGATRPRRPKRVVGRVERKARASLEKKGS